jgi:hypothetical protein
VQPRAVIVDLAQPGKCKTAEHEPVPPFQKRSIWPIKMRN